MTVTLMGLSIGAVGAFQPDASAQALGSGLDRQVLRHMGELDGQFNTTALSRPMVPAVAASNDPASSAAGAALWALWFDDPTYETKLDALIPLVAFRALVPPDQLAAVWKATDKQRMIVVLSALTQLGVPYHRYTSLQGVAFDCSGLTAWAWAQVGLQLPHQSLRQLRASTQKLVDQQLPGDLFYYPGHIMLALGVGNAMIHAPFTGSRIEVRPMMKGRLNRFKVASPVG